jgi:hypothetical protein
MVFGGGRYVGFPLPQITILVGIPARVKSEPIQLSIITLYTNPRQIYLY